MNRKFFVVASTILSMTAGTFAMNGKAVAVVTLMNGATNTSRLIVATISSNVVTKVDTIVRGTAGKPLFIPTFCLDGSKIAFFQSGAGVSVVDATGGNLHTVAKTADWGGLSVQDHLSWPAIDGSKWIYYHKPGAKGEIWKVNVLDTTQNFLVCDYIKGATGSNFQNWSLSADGKYCAMRALGTWAQDPAGYIGYNGGIWPHTFPPKVNTSTGWIDPALTAPSICCNLNSECNVGISASGNLLCHFSGQHTAVYGVTWNHAAATTAGNNPRTLFTLANIEGWIKPSPVMSNPGIGDSFLRPRGSSNSDKIFTAIVNWPYAEYNTDGSNLIVANWKDQEAAIVTNNPNTSPRWIVDPGDFWADGGSASTYQDVNGAWVTLNTGVERGIGDAHSTSRLKKSGAHENTALYSITGKRISGFFKGDRCSSVGAYIAIGRNAGEKLLVIGNRIQRK
jgi:hypothetical protein